MFPWEYVLYTTKSEGGGLIVRAISFQDFQRMWSWSTNVTDGQTGDMTGYCISRHRRLSRGVFLFASSCISGKSVACNIAASEERVIRSLAGLSLVGRDVKWLMITALVVTAVCEPACWWCALDVLYSSNVCSCCSHAEDTAAWDASNSLDSTRCRLQSTMIRYEFCLSNAMHSSMIGQNIK